MQGLTFHPSGLHQMQQTLPTPAREESSLASHVLATTLTSLPNREAPATFTYFRPGGVDTYKRPGGVDTYQRP